MTAIKNKMSLRQAINNKCKDCTFDYLAEGNWKQQVSLCTVKKCPLWSVRPQTSGRLFQPVDNS